MENEVTEEELSLVTATMYGLLSFSVVLALTLVIILACRRRRYTLNWFEKNLLEAANAKEISQSEETLMGYCEGSCEKQKSGKFWVPSGSLLPRSSSSSLPVLDTTPTPLSAVDTIAPMTPVQPTLQQEDSLDSTTSGPATPKTPASVSSASESGGSQRQRLSSMQTRLDHTKIDTTLYQKSATGETNFNLGSLHLTLLYDPPAGILSVRLLAAHDLRPRDFSGTADPYAKIRLLPDRSNVWQTRIHKKTLNPVFDEDFVFEVEGRNFARRTLEVLLYDFDAYSRHHCIGGLHLPLAQLELARKTTLRKPLAPYKPQEGKDELGDLMVSLSFLPSAERLTVVVLKARNLRIVDDSRSASDPHVRVNLVNSETNRRNRKKRTSTQRGTINPIFNEALTFDVSREILSRSTIELLVMNEEEVLGVTRLGQKSSGDELTFFREMLASRTATARWLPLNDPD